jgi:hypothetical protein
MANFVNVVISGNAGPLKTALNAATVNMSSFQKKVATGFIVAGAAATAFAVSAIKAAAKDQEAMRNLERQLRASAGATDAQIASAEKYLKVAGRASAFSKSALIPGYQSLVLATHDVTKAQSIMNVAIDTARARNLDISTVSDALSKAYAGNTRALRSLSPELKKAIADGASFSDVLKILNENFGGAGAEYAKTFNGRLQILNNTTASLKKQIGAGLLPVVESIIPVFQAVADALAKNPKIVMALTVTVGALSAAFITASLGLAAWTLATKTAAVATALFGAEITALQVATGFIIVTLAAAAAAYVLFDNKAANATDASYKFSTALYTQNEAQKQQIASMIKSDPAFAKMISFMTTMGVKASDLSEFLATGTNKAVDDFSIYAYAAAGSAKKLSDNTDLLGKKFVDAAIAAGLSKKDLANFVLTIDKLAQESLNYKKALETMDILGLGDQTTAASDAADKAAKKWETFVNQLKNAKKEIRAYAAEISRAISSTVSLSTAVKDAADTNATQSETLKTALEDRRKAYEDLDQAKATRDVVAYNKALGDVAAAEARVSEAQKAKPTDYTAVFRAQIDAAKKFAGLLQQLIAQGLQKPGVAQLLDLGPIAGAQVASDLLAGTQGLTVGGLNADLAAVAAAGTAAGMAVPGAAAALTATPNKNYTITVNAGVGDKTEIGKQVVAALQQYEARFGAIPVKVKK